MISILHCTEYRIVIPGRAVSFRSPHAKDYKNRVRKAAKKVLPESVTVQSVEVRIDCFHRTKRRFDMDNVAKCILDALNGLAYLDDRQVKLQSSVAHSLREPVHIRGGPVDLVKPLRHHDEYLFIRVRAVGKHP